MKLAKLFLNTVTGVVLSMSFSIFNASEVFSGKWGLEENNVHAAIAHVEHAIETGQIEEAKKILSVKDRATYIARRWGRVTDDIFNSCFKLENNFPGGYSYSVRQSVLQEFNETDFLTSMKEKRPTKKVIAFVQELKALGIRKESVLYHLSSCITPVIPPEAKAGFLVEKEAGEDFADAVKGFVDRFYDVIEPMKSTPPTAAAGGGGGGGN